MSECKHDYVYNHEFRLTRCSKCLVVKKEVNWKDRADKAEAQVEKLLRFINANGLSDQLKAFCLKEHIEK